MTLTDDIVLAPAARVPDTFILPAESVPDMLADAKVLAPAERVPETVAEVNDVLPAEKEPATDADVNDAEPLTFNELVDIRTFCKSVGGDSTTLITYNVNDSQILVVTSS